MHWNVVFEQHFDHAVKRVGEYARLIQRRQRIRNAPSNRALISPSVLKKAHGVGILVMMAQF